MYQFERTLRRQLDRDARLPSYRFLGVSVSILVVSATKIWICTEEAFMLVLPKEEY